MEILTINIAAGETKPYAIGGNYFEIVDAVSAIDVVLTALETQQEDSMRGALAGSYAKTQFSNFSITSAAAQTIRVLVSSREGGTRRLSGSVTVTNDLNVTVKNTAGAFTQSEPAITNAASTPIAANAARRYLLVQNNDNTANLRVTLDGSVPTAAHGIKITPGGSLELAGFVPTGAVKVIADQPTAVVTVVEG